MIEQNDRFAKFSAPISALLSSYSDDFVSVEVELRSSAGQVVRALIRRSVDGSNIILTRADGANQSKDRALGIMLRALHEDRDLYRSAVYALAKALGWRWIGIGRFRGNGTVDVIAWCDGGRFTETFSYELAGTPCEEVAKTGNFQAFEHVARLFPKDVALARYGAEYYAGQVYLGRDGVPLGHVFMLDDQVREHTGATEEVLTLVCELVGAQLRLQATEEVAEQAMLVARTDSLTGVRNRTAFDEDVDLLAERYATGAVRDALLVAIDLDGTKRVNDLRGHSAGDELLRRFCEGLRITNRSTDRVYRIGGDEFVLILANSDEGERQMVRDRIDNVVAGVCEDGFPEMDASIGFATLRECEGEVRAALRLADDRMYAQKRGKKRALGK
ncbi:MAG: GGDEF domain-containing protein [Candidatus Eremiobacteraeota bacterium]|nr:GGDEF domain-containing protein [Candidatus Eremiobacteraeota bacterium]